jgi:hypothetical protein
MISEYALKLIDKKILERKLREYSELLSDSKEQESEKREELEP